MKSTLSIIKADIGSIGGHIRPSARLIKRVEEHISDKGRSLESTEGSSRRWRNWSPGSR